MTGQVIEEMLGKEWWRRPHSATVLLATVDKVRDASEVELETSIDQIRDFTIKAIYNLGGVDILSAMDIARAFTDLLWIELRKAGVIE